MSRELELVVLEETRTPPRARRAPPFEDVRECEAEPQALQPGRRVVRIEKREVPFDEKVIDATERTRREPRGQQLELAAFETSSLSMTLSSCRSVRRKNAPKSIEGTVTTPR